jgi:hypothetical protein
MNFCIEHIDTQMVVILQRWVLTPTNCIFNVLGARVHVLVMWEWIRQHRGRHR